MTTGVFIATQVVKANLQAKVPSNTKNENSVVRNTIVHVHKPDLSFSSIN